LLTLAVKNAQFDLGSMSGEESEVRACAIPKGAYGVRRPLQDSICRFLFRTGYLGQDN
jgi:hypothetical protein